MIYQSRFSLLYPGLVMILYPGLVMIYRSRFSLLYPGLVMIYRSRFTATTNIENGSRHYTASKIEKYW